MSTRTDQLIGTQSRESVPFRNRGNSVGYQLLGTARRAKGDNVAGSKLRRGNRFADDDRAGEYRGLHRAGVDDVGLVSEDSGGGHRAQSRPAGLIRRSY